MNTHSFVSSLEAHANKPLVFDYSGGRIGAGYHVTEVMASRVRGLDCGSNPEAWSETIVQLWDVAGAPDGTHMTAGKFVGIVSKVASQLGLEDDARLVFECGTSTGPAAHYTLDHIRLEGDQVVAQLEPKRVSCKPQDRATLSAGLTMLEVSSGEGCCTPASASSSGTTCCG